MAEDPQDATIRPRDTYPPRRKLNGAEGKAELYRRQVEDQRRAERNEIVHDIGGLLASDVNKSKMLTIDWGSMSLNKAQLEAAKAQLADIEEAREHGRTLEEAMLGLVKLTQLGIEQDANRHEETSTASADEFRQNLKWTKIAGWSAIIGIPTTVVLGVLAILLA
jgi:hypothetical protein